MALDTSEKAELPISADDAAPAEDAGDRATSDLSEPNMSDDRSGDADSDTTAETHTAEKERSQLSLVALEMQCLAQLRASVTHYERLPAIAEHAKEVIARIEPGKRVVVYGSLALGGPDDRYYLTRTSDADLAIEVAAPQSVVKGFTDEGWEV